MPITTEIRLNRAERRLEVTFDDGAAFRLPAEYLRVESPSAEVQGHGPGQKTQAYYTSVINHFVKRLRAGEPPVIDGGGEAAGQGGAAGASAAAGGHTYSQSRSQP